MYSLTQPMLAVVSPMEVAGTTTVERTSAGTRFLIFMARMTPGCAKDVSRRPHCSNRATTQKRSSTMVYVRMHRHRANHRHHRGARDAPRRSAATRAPRSFVVRNERLRFAGRDGDVQPFELGGGFDLA